ncbi:MAG: DUF1772 domain-containing protein [Proteobacteria bacterium]|nr:DUF1772 domain-containing protein [Pseudomonadota bacterium]
MGLETRVAALQWAPSYKRATWLQAPLAVLSFLCGIGAWLLGAGVAWLVAGRDLSSEETRALLVRWGALHAVRTVLSLAGTLLFVWLLFEA